MNRRRRTKATLFHLPVLCMLGLCLLGVAAGRMAHAESANSLFKQGEAAEDRDDIDTAYDKFYKAYQKNPSDLRFRTAYYRLRFSCAALHTKRGVALREKGEYSAALTEFLHALEVDPSNELARQEIEATREKMKTPGGESSIPITAASELSSVASPIDLKPISNEPITLHMSEDTKVVYQTIGKAAGINVLFDPEYTSKRIQIDLSNVSLFDGLRIMGAVSGTFWRAVTSNTIFVAANTRAKRTELDEQAVQTFYLTNASQANDLNDIQTALRNVLANAKLYGVPSQNAIVMRGTPDELLLASKLIDDLDKARPEVVVDVAVLEVSRDKMRNIGISLPGMASLSLQSSTATSTTTPADGTTTTPSTTSTNNLSLNDLAQLSASNFAVTVGQATVNLLLSDTDTKILQNPRIRASDNQKATMKIGSRIPIATGSFSSGTSSALASSLVNTQFQYLDIGVNIDMTPVVHYDRDVTLKLKIEVSSHNGDVTISGVTEPIISQRTIEQVIRLREGEANILGGILTKADSRAISGTPGLGELPLLKYFFSSNSHEVQQDEIVFLLIPHVVRATQLSLLNTRQIDTGTGNTVEIRRTAAPAPLPPPIGEAATEPSVTTTPAPPQLRTGAALPGQTASAAAANALATVGADATGIPGHSPGAMPLALQLVPANGTQKLGSTFQVAVNLSGGKDVFSVPLQAWFDPNKLALINVDSGTFLGRDGQAIALVHRDDGAGNVTVSASRPPGVAGVDGAGTVCIFTFQAKAAGDAIINITKPGARNSAQQAIEATGSQATVHIQ